MTKTDVFWTVILALCLWAGTFILVYLILAAVQG